MSSWLSSHSSNNNVGDVQHSRSGWSTTSNHPSPGRREHAVQPPPLTTALGGHQFQGLGVALGPGYASTPTPLSSTSLSSPFTQGQSPCVSTPSSAAVAPSPMAPRPYNVPYNPRDWGPVGNASASTGQSPYPQSSNSGSMRRMVHPSGL